MNDLARQVEAARQELHVARDEAWLELQARRFHAGRRARARFRRAAWSAALAAGFALAVVGALQLRVALEGSRHVQARAVPAATSVPMPDGSMATPFDDLTVLRTKQASETLAVVEVVRGGARFEVVHRSTRLFRVEAGPALIEVLGTEFTAERIGSRTRVSVLSGQVQVTCGGLVSQLVEGETGIFPRPLASPEPGPAASVELAPIAAPSADAATKVGRVGQWRSLASQGKLPEAYLALQSAGWPTSDASSLLEAADVARLTHHPAQAVAPLRKMLDGYPKDPRAAAAAFTLGRVLMEVGDFGGAAEAFARTRRLDREGAISEDALAREVEASSRAGDRARARARANDYVRSYPAGRRLASVRLLGGLE